MAGAARRAGVALVVVLLAVVGLAVGGKVLFNVVKTAVRSDGCDFASYSLDTGQAQVASVIVGVVLRRDLPERAAVLTIAAALQESKLKNLAAGQGDRDSVGILQQRPSQGWGTAAQISNVSYATGKFLDAVVKVDNWQSDTLASVVQKVQISADGTAYAQHEDEAQAVSDALSGKVAAGVNCHFDQPTQAGTTAAVLKALKANLPVSTPTVSGRTVTVPGAGWATSAWLVCNAQQLNLDSVTYNGKQWTRANGWRSDASAASTAVITTLSS